MATALDCLYKTKLQLLEVISAVAGAALLLIARAASAEPNLAWLTDLPVVDIGSALVQALSQYQPVLDLGRQG